MQENLQCLPKVIINLPLFHSIRYLPTVFCKVARNVTEWCTSVGKVRRAGDCTYLIQTSMFFNIKVEKCFDEKSVPFSFMCPLT